MILGIDEAGRGPWAGPLVVGAVVLGGAEIEGLTDSKKLTKKKREVIDVQVRNCALGYGLGWVSADELDSIGMSAALRIATIRAVTSISCRYDEIIIDGTVNFLRDTGKGKYVKTMAKADLLIPSVSAASVVAKVARDRYMTKLSEQYSEYGFATNAGYGTAKHRQAIEGYGVTPEHRLSFAPLRKYKKTDNESVQENITDNLQATTKVIGDAAEEKVAEYLVESSHAIIARNWKTRYCEIDIISVKNGVVYFTEVKYRRSKQHGDGIAAINPKKQKQMRFAAELYIASHPQLKELDQRLAVASVSGEGFSIDALFDIF